MRTITTICAYEDDTNEILKAIDEEFVEVSADLDMYLEEVDYGVPGSPVWKQVYNYDIETIYINDEDYTLEQFKAKYDDVVVKEVMRLIDDAVDELDLY